MFNAWLKIKARRPQHVAMEDDFGYMETMRVSTLDSHLQEAFEIARVRAQSNPDYVSLRNTLGSAIGIYTVVRHKENNEQ
jgi:hypothetical protein